MAFLSVVYVANEQLKCNSRSPTAHLRLRTNQSAASFLSVCHGRRMVRVNLCSQTRKQRSSLGILHHPSLIPWAWFADSPLSKSQPSSDSGPPYGSLKSMFSADLTWTPVVEVRPKRSDRNPSSPPSEVDTDQRERQSPLTLGNSVSVTSSASSRKLSVFRWSKGRRPGTSSFGHAGSIRRRTSVSVAEMPEDRGPERHELSAASQSRPPWKAFG
jgi:hypothetical protein